MNKRTPLYDDHVALGAKMCPFAGYDMPINYKLGVIKEHEWTREKAGMFDVSHMGQAIVRGAKATEFFEHITPSSFANLANGRAKYTVLTNEQGGIIDDLIITRFNDETFFVVFNAGRKEGDIAWMQKNLPQGVSFEELKDRALIALQGPKAAHVLMQELDDEGVTNLPYMSAVQAEWDDEDLYVSRLGYTGEDGFEISVPVDMALSFWKALLAYDEVETIGLAARDSLRLEMGYPLYGHDLSEETSPIEASIGWVIGKDNTGFIGADNILPQRENCPRRRVGVKIEGAGIAREGAMIYVGDKKIGELTSGGFSPSLKVAIGQGYVTSEYAKEGTKIEVEVRGKRIPASIHGLSFVSAKTKSSQLKKAS
ncbi:MAG: glycine cleavage system aminomethyltransferase GcvT [Rickettsiales bacterium]